MDNNQPSDQKKTLSLKKEVPDHIKKLIEIKQKTIATHAEDKKKFQNKKTSARVKEKNPTMEWLYATFPKAFLTKGQQPLKVNIVYDIFHYIEQQNKEQDNDFPSHRSIRNTLKHYVDNVYYLKACIRDAPRFDLNGEPSGSVGEKEADYAQKKYDRVMKIIEKKMAQKKGKPFVKKVHKPETLENASN